MADAPTSTPTDDEIFGPKVVPVGRPPIASAADFSGLAELTDGASIDAIEDALLRVRLSLGSGHDRLTREAVRAEIRAKYPFVPARMVDAAVAPIKTTAATDEPASRRKPAPVALVKDDEPHDHPVDGAQLLDETAALVRRYIALPQESAHAIALWIAGAWTLDAAQIAPILAIVAASMRCGKSTLAELVGACCPRSIMVASLTPAVLFRLIDEYHPTLIADEADTWLADEKSELRGIWNAGHSRSTAVVARCVGENNEVKLFSVFAPRVLAMIGRPPATILDRSIVIELKRKRADEQVERLRRDRLEATAAAIRRKWRRWADDHAARLDGADPAVPSELHDRAQDNWRHLFAIAELAGGEWPAHARRAALVSAESAADESEGIGVELLGDIRRVFDERKADDISSADIVAALVAMDGRPWAEWSHGRPLTTAKLARLLKPFRVHPVDVRLPAGVRKCYTRRSLLDAWSRYLPEKAQQRNNLNVYGPESPKTKAQQTDPCCAFESATNPINTGECCGVALSDGKTAPVGEGEGVGGGPWLSF